MLNPELYYTTWTYDGKNRLTVGRLGNGTRSSYTYDDADQLLRRVNLGTAGATLSSFAYLYDPVGNRTRVVEASGDRVSWTYDRLQRLTREMRSGASACANTHGYDVAGNRTRTIASGAITTAAYDVCNQLIKAQNSTGITTYSYDASGNLAAIRNPSGQRTTGVWDTENRLISVRLPGATIDSFTYDGRGTRVKAINSAGTTNFLWDLRNVLVETDGTGATTAVHTLRPDVFGDQVSQNRSGTTSFYHFDGLGSTDSLSNATGAVTDNYRYDAFGNELLVIGSTTNPFRYVGQQGYQRDRDTAWYHVRARYYDPSTARFLSRDPSVFDMLGSNLYMYVGANPIRMTDPSGLAPTDLACVTGNNITAGIAKGAFDWKASSFNINNMTKDNTAPFWITMPMVRQYQTKTPGEPTVQWWEKANKEIQDPPNAPLSANVWHDRSATANQKNVQLRGGYIYMVDTPGVTNVRQGLSAYLYHLEIKIIVINPPPCTAKKNKWILDVELIQVIYWGWLLRIGQIAIYLDGSLIASLLVHNVQG
jgi:RHS repeat-associated protein